LRNVYVSHSGDIMPSLYSYNPFTGKLDEVNDLSQVDPNAIYITPTQLTAALAAYVQKTGDTMTGNLTMTSGTKIIMDG
jgi:hypothetical protein